MFRHKAFPSDVCVLMGKHLTAKSVKMKEGRNKGAGKAGMSTSLWTSLLSYSWERGTTEKNSKRMGTVRAECKKVCPTLRYYRR